MVFKLGRVAHETVASAHESRRPIGPAARAARLAPAAALRSV